MSSEWCIVFIVKKNTINNSLVSFMCVCEYTGASDLMGVCLAGDPAGRS